MSSSKLVAVVTELSKHGNVSESLRKAKASRSWVYEKRQTDREFADAFDEAKRCGLEVLEDEAHRRAYQGVRKPVFYQGEQVAEVQEFSDTLLIFLLKALNPAKYRERHLLEHANAGGRPFMFQMQLHPDAVAATKGGAK